MQSQVILGGFVVSTMSVAVNPKKVRTIRDWAKPTNIHRVQSFHGLPTFYRKFVKNFNTIISHVTNCIKKGEFTWKKVIARAFVEINERITQARLLWLSKIACDASETEIGGVLSQEGHFIAYFSKKKHSMRQNIDTPPTTRNFVLLWKHNVIVTNISSEILSCILITKHLANWISSESRDTGTLNGLSLLSILLSSKYWVGLENCTIDNSSRIVFIL